MEMGKNGQRLLLLPGQYPRQSTEALPLYVWDSGGAERGFKGA